MENLIIAATERSPQVAFDVTAGTLSIRGESYPEDASGVFGPIFAALRDYLADGAGKFLRVDFELIYFNSSSAKALMNMFQMLDNAGDARIEVNWQFMADDETMKEFGEDFAEDLEHVVFNLVAVP